MVTLGRSLQLGQLREPKLLIAHLYLRPGNPTTYPQATRASLAPSEGAIITRSRLLLIRLR
jgi:hypothetical protein